MLEVAWYMLELVLGGLRAEVLELLPYIDELFVSLLSLFKVFAEIPEVVHQYRRVSQLLLQWLIDWR